MENNRQRDENSYLKIEVKPNADGETVHEAVEWRTYLQLSPERTFFTESSRSSM